MQKLFEFQRFTQKMRETNQASQIHTDKTHQSSPNKCLPNTRTARLPRALPVHISSKRRVGDSRQSLMRIRKVTASLPSTNR